MKALKYIKSLFNFKNKKLVTTIKKSKIIKSKDMNQYENIASFTNYNNNTIIVYIKVVNNKPLLFIKHDKEELIFDKDSAALLMLLINDYIFSESFKNFENFIKGENSEKR